jgi:hypothetical protein
VAGGLDPKRLDVLAAKRPTVRQKRVEQTRQSAIKDSAAVGRRLEQLTPVLPPVNAHLSVDAEGQGDSDWFIGRSIAVDAASGSFQVSVPISSSR